MAAFNVVRYRVKAGKEERFLQLHREFRFELDGFRKGSLIKTGDRRYCFIGEWDSAAKSLAAESTMVGWLNQFRDTLEDLGNGLGVTDPVVGDSLIDY